MWIRFDLNGLLFKLNIDNYGNDEYVDISFEYKFKDIINYKKDKQKILLNKDIDTLKRLTKSLIEGTLSKNEYFCSYEPDFAFEFLGGRWLVIETFLWNDEDLSRITDNSISISLEMKEIEQLYYYLQLQTKEIDIDDQKIQEMIEKNIIYNE